MKLWVHRIELIVDRLIPLMLVILLGVIIIDIWFIKIAEQYHTTIIAIDYFVLAVFWLDLTFKYIRIKPFTRFLKKSWIDILAVLPFATAFRAFESFFGIGETVEKSQMIFHEGVEIEKESARVNKEMARIVKEAGKVSRTGRFAKLVRPIARMPRLVKAFSFYEKPTGKHYPHERVHRKRTKTKTIFFTILFLVF